MDVNLIVIHFSVATQEQSTKFNAVQILQGTTVFLLGTLLYVSPDQVIGHFNDYLGLWIMVVQFLLLNNLEFLLILMSTGGGIIRPKENSVVRDITDKSWWSQCRQHL